MTVKNNSFKKRITWGFNPVIRTVPSKKVYNRFKNKQALKKEFDNARV